MNRQANPQRLTEAELDAANAERFAAPAGHDADTLPDMWQDERSSPWLLALYAAVFVLAMAGSALWPWGFAQ